MKEGSSCRAAHSGATARPGHPCPGLSWSVLASPGQGGDQHRTCPAPTCGRQWEKVIPTCSKLLLQWCHSTSPASLHSHTGSIFSLPPPGHVQALDNIRVLHARPLNGTLNSLTRWEMSLPMEQDDL